MQQFTTKKLYRLIDIIDAVQRGETKLLDIPEKDKLNYLMDQFNIKNKRRKRRSIPISNPSIHSNSVNSESNSEEADASSEENNENF